eukprot:tig00020553_g10688.t1
MAAAEENFHLGLRCPVIGAARCGKSTLIRRHMGTAATPSSGAEVQPRIEFHNRLYEIEERTYSITYWDVSLANATEMMVLEAKRLCASSPCYLFVFDVTSKRSLEEIALWDSNLFVKGAPGLRVLIANKSDLPDREVSPADAEAFASSKNMVLLEVSAETSPDAVIENVFATLVELVHDMYSPMDPKSLAKFSIRMGKFALAAAAKAGSGAGAKMRAGAGAGREIKDVSTTVSWFDGPDSPPAEPVHAHQHVHADA